MYNEISQNLPCFALQVLELIIIIIFRKKQKNISIVLVYEQNPNTRYFDDSTPHVKKRTIGHVGILLGVYVVWNLDKVSILK